jgi:crotonobetainyl-CoA:carnitine CoA-transferase CaiB-like acyl-CoA transferase
MKQPLSGITVVELGTYVAAPALGNLLGTLGASVIKVEPLQGDPTRKLTPWSWANYNWNKKSVALDLKYSAGAKAMKGLLHRADVFIESLSPRAIRDLGLDFRAVRKLNPKIIYCSIKGFASDSSSAHRVGFDTIAQAEGGLMYVAGESGRPSRVGNPCVDLSAAAFGAVGILSAMLARPRRATLIEIPLYDLVVYWNGYWLPYIDIHGSEPSSLSTSHPGFSPYGIFSAKDGHVFIGVLADPQWVKLVEKLSISSPSEFSEMSARIMSRDEVNAMVQEAVKNFSVAELLEKLGGDVPCAKVSSLMDIYKNEELRSRGVVKEIGEGGRQVSIALPPYLRGLVPKKVRGPRALGADNDVELRKVKGRDSRKGKTVH